MVTITRELIQEVRDRTGLGLMDCRKALEETGCDVEKAVDLLRMKGAAVAIKRAGKETSEGVVQAYIHPGNKLGVLVEIDCETDFVANTTEVQQFANDLCMHIAALKPLYLSPADVDPKFLEHEIDILKAQLADSGKPANVIDKIVEGKITKFYSDICLLQQAFVKNDQLTVEQKVQELIGKTGEKIQIRRFSRFEISA